MNAGAMGGAVFETVELVRVMDYEGEIHEKTPNEMQVSYRSCSTLRTHVALSAVLKGRVEAKDQIESRMTAFSQKRWKSQPAAPSAGCVFKNPVSVLAGKLIDELGLKGFRVGGAVVSEEAGNFIINAGKASAKDFLQLIEVVGERAGAARQIRLETEVEIVGE